MASKLTPEPLPFTGSTLTYNDAGVEPGVTYHYWVEVHRADGSSFMNRPVSHGPVRSRSDVPPLRRGNPSSHGAPRSTTRSAPRR